MTRLTDDELGELLRETFTGQEELIDKLPEATKRRSRVPVLLAAAAVLAVLAGVLYGVHRVGAPDPVEPAGTATAPDHTGRDAEIWAAAIETIVRKNVPKSGWTTALVMDLSDVGKHHLRKGPPMSPPQRRLMAATVDPTIRLGFRGEFSPASVTCPNHRTVVLQVSDVLEKSGHLEVNVAIFYGCTQTDTARYRVEPKGQDWVVTATLGRWAN
ncbi:hypothetical protein [Kribbella kalugense]|uniref:Uncharacterized protein n=1 Tax=Kribbella kalugense TaxID=2512221 RepID=A0A4V3G7E2_9ACTN|nr:hypothetical protein [Kribbella kalugense]TDW18674.1 hypothetical protein EV650_5269 [Kribbella kalugense]